MDCGPQLQRSGMGGREGTAAAVTEVGGASPPRLWFLAARAPRRWLTTGLSSGPERQTPQQDAGPPLHRFRRIDEQG
jgi:hypothetical protein